MILPTTLLSCDRDQPNIQKLKRNNKLRDRKNYLEMTSSIDREYQNHILWWVKSFIKFSLIASLSCPNSLLYWEFQIFSVATFYNEIPNFSCQNDKSN